MNESRETECLSPLQFIFLLNGREEFLALIDSGAQLNLLSEELLKFLNSYEIISSSVTHLKAVNDTSLLISQWIKVSFSLSNGEQVGIPFAVVKDIKSVIILGLPFLTKLRGQIDYRNKVISTPKGPILLMDGYKSGHSRHVNEIEADRIESIISSAHLSVHGKEKLRSILETYKMLYHNDKRGEVKGLSHSIILTTKRPVTTKARIHSEEHEKAIAQEVEKMLADGVIVPSDSPYSSEIVMVRKKTGEWRMCIDYRPLNKHTIDDKYPLPRISDLLFSIKDSKYFVALDLRSGYWQIPMDSDCRKMTAFRCSKGLFEFRVMPFGLKNAPATFQRNMDFLLGDMRFKNVLVYIDDILIHHADEDRCMHLLEEVFLRLQNAGMTINLAKSEFFPDDLKYLGHIIKGGKLRPDPDKIRILEKIEAPKTVSEVRSLLGMIGYFQSYIPAYSKLAVPMTNLLKCTINKKRINKVTFVEWSDECDRSLKQMINHLAEAVLTTPVDSDVFEIETDASDYAIGGVLMVRREEGPLPVYFISKKLSSTEVKWATREKEAFAIVYCLKKFDRFIRPRHFTVTTDHQSLQWLFEAKLGKLSRWAILLSEYNFTIKWRKGTGNVVADYLSRYIDAADPVEDRMVYKIEVDSEAIISLEEILKAQQGEETPSGRGYIVRGKTVHYRGGLWVPMRLRKKVVAACHLLPPIYHPGIKRTKNLILRVFNWPGLHDDVTNYIKGCLICQRQRGNALSNPGRYIHNPAEGAFMILHIDFWECRYQGEWQKVLTMIDPFTRWTEAESLSDRSAKKVASSILRNWICRFGVPRRLVSDNEAGFVGDLMTEFTSTLGIHHITSIPYRPQGNAPLESFHRSLNKFFTFTFWEIPFEDALQLALYSYRTLLHSITNESPAFLVYGRDLVPPQDCDWRFFSEVNTQERIKFVNDLRQDMVKQAQSRLEMCQRANDLPAIEVNDLVLVKARPPDLANHVFRDATSQKLLPHWSLPARVERLTNNRQRVIVRFLVTGGSKLVHISEVKQINLPQDKHQRRQWKRLYASETDLTEKETTRPQLQHEVKEVKKQKIQRGH